MADYKKDMGKRLSVYRKSLHLTQEQVAEMLDISLKHYSELERGVTGISVDGLISLSDKLGINIDYLLRGSEITTSIPKEFAELYDTFTEKQKLKLFEFLKILSDFKD